MAQDPSRSPRLNEARSGAWPAWSFERRRLVLLLWIIGLVGVTVVAQGVGSRFQDSFSSGNSPSQRVQNILQARFPQAAGTTADVVIHTHGPVASPATMATTAKLVSAVQALPHVSGVVSPFSPQATHQVSAGGHIAFAVVQFDQAQSAISSTTVNRVVRHGQVVRLTRLSGGAGRPGHLQGDLAIARLE